MVNLLSGVAEKANVRLVTKSLGSMTRRLQPLRAPSTPVALEISNLSVPPPLMLTVLVDVDRAPPPVTVIDTVAAFESIVPSLALKVKLAVPLKIESGA